MYMGLRVLQRIFPPGMNFLKSQGNPERGIYHLWFIGGKLMGVGNLPQATWLVTDRAPMQSRASGFQSPSA